MIYGDKSYWWLEKQIKKAAYINQLISYQKVSGSHFFMFENPSIVKNFF